jgi:hypothetical protein
MEAPDELVSGNMWSACDISWSRTDEVLPQSRDLINICRSA